MTPTYSFNVYALPPAVTALALLLVGVAVLIRERASRVSVAFLFILLATSVWLFGLTAMYCATNEAVAIWWARFHFLGIPFIPSTIYLFSVVVMGIYARRKRLIWAGLLLSAFFSAAALYSDVLVAGVYRYWWGYYPRYGWLGILFLAFFFGLALANRRDYWVEYRKAAPGTRKLRLRALFMAFGIAYLGGLDYLPCYGVPLYAFGYLPVFVCLALTARVTQRYRLVDIAPAFAANEILATMADPLAVCDADGRIRVVNQALCATLGYTEQELLGERIECLAGADSGGVEHLRQLLSPGTARNEEMVFQTKGGEPVAVSISLSPLQDRGRNRVGTVLIARDIRERKRAEAEQAALFEIAKDIAGVVDLKEILNRVHQRVATLLPCDRIVTYYWDVSRNTYRALAWHGVPSRLVPDGVALEFHSGQPVSERLLAGEAVLINDIADQSLVPLEMFTHFGITAVLVVPLVVRGRRMGALAAHNSESGRRFDPRQVRLFEGIAQQVSVAIEAADLYRAQEEETAVAVALARIGQELISSLSSPALLDRLCQLTTEALGCDHSRTWLWHASDEAFVPVARYSDSPEQWDMMRLVKLGRSALATQLDGMERNGVFNFKVADLPDSEAKVWARAYGLTVSLMVPLRRGGELVGFQTANYRGREGVFGERHERIARGIGQLVSLALENVRLIEELERASRLKSDFMSTMSHELRTPLSIIIGYHDLLLGEVFGPMGPDQVDTLRRTQKSAGELLALITATLDVGRLEAGKGLLDVQEIDLGELSREIAGETTSLPQTPTVSVVWDVPAELPRLHTDRAKLKVVVKNLLANAVKFTEHGQVTVRARACDGGAEIAVADTGIGISPDVLPIIFEPFRQAESGATSRRGGVGLGLYIVRRYLDLLGGTIRVESELGRGSTFRVWLPSGAPAGIP